MSEDPDGRQARPTDDVGRPDWRTKRFTLDGRTLARLLRAAFWQGAEAEERGVASAQRADAEALEIIAIHAEETGQGLRRREAPHGETAPDATEVADDYPGDQPSRF